MKEIKTFIKFDSDLLIRLRLLRRKAELATGASAWYIIASRVHESKLLRLATGEPSAIDGMVILLTDSCSEHLVYLRQRTAVDREVVVDGALGGLVVPGSGRLVKADISNSKAVGVDLERNGQERPCKAEIQTFYKEKGKDNASFNTKQNLR